MRGGGERVGSMQSRGLPGGAAMYSSQPRAAQRSLTDTDPAPRNPLHGHTRREIIRKNGILDSVCYIFTIWGVDWTLDRNVLHDEEIPRLTIRGTSSCLVYRNSPVIKMSTWYYRVEYLQILLYQKLL